MAQESKYLIALLADLADFRKKHALRWIGGDIGQYHTRNKVSPCEQRRYARLRIRIARARGRHVDRRLPWWSWIDFDSRVQGSSDRTIRRWFGA